MPKRKLPYHIAIIPDGNRRFAKRLMMKPWKGHEWGTEKLKSVLEWCGDAGIKMVTFYSLSLENIERRPKREIDYLYSISRKEMTDILENPDNFVHKFKARIKCFGKLSVLPEDVQNLIKEVEEKTSHYNNYILNLAIAYGGTQEILNAVKNIAKDVLDGNIDSEKIDESVLSERLYTAETPDPDMIIRTGGEKRLSNFLPLQSVYSELFFIDTLWPELTREEFMDSVKSYSERKRRFGA